MISWQIFLIILGYALIMSMFGITYIKPKIWWTDAFLDIFKIAIPTALIEEFIFRYLIMYLLLIIKLGLSVQLATIYSALFFSLTHFLWGMYRNGSEHQTASELASLVIGLTLFGMVTSKLFFFPFQNIVFHAMAIYGVQLTSVLFANEDEDKWYLWDNGHQLLRAWPIWIILVLIYMI